MVARGGAHFTPPLEQLQKVIPPRQGRGTMWIG